MRATTIYAHRHTVLIWQIIDFTTCEQDYRVHGVRFDPVLMLIVSTAKLASESRFRVDDDLILSR